MLDDNEKKDFDTNVEAIERVYRVYLYNKNTGGFSSKRMLV